MASGKPSVSAVRPASHVAFRRINSSGVLVHLRGNGIYELNETGTRIWELLQDEADPHVVVDRLVDEYGADRADVESSVSELVGNLTRLGLVEA